MKRAYLVQVTVESNREISDEIAAEMIRGAIAVGSDGLEEAFDITEPVTIRIGRVAALISP